MTFKVNGVDLLPYIAKGGIKWQRNDIEASDAGRTLDGIMHRGRVTTKVRLDVTCLPLPTAKLHIVLQAIYPEFVTVQYDDPFEGGVVTKTMYSNNVPSSCIQRQDDGSALWDEITFPLIER